MIPKRDVNDFAALTQAEANDIIMTLVAFNRNFRSEAHQIRMFLNKGEASGQSVPHLHWHIVIRTSRPQSLFDEAASYDSSACDTEVIKTYLLGKMAWTVGIEEFLPRVDVCRPCWYAHGKSEMDEHHLVMYRDSDLLAVMPPSSQWSGQVAIMPTQHYEAIGQMPDQKLHKLIAMVQRMSPIVMKVASERIRDCRGLNTEVISYGQKDKKKSKFTHLFWLLTPRTPTKNPSAIDINGGGYHPFWPKAYAQDIVAALHAVPAISEAKSGTHE